MFKYWTTQLYVLSLATFLFIYSFFYCFKAILPVVLIVYHISLIDLLVYKLMYVCNFAMYYILCIHMDFCLK